MTVAIGAQLKTNLLTGGLSSTHFTVRTVMPLLLGVLADAYGLPEGQLGNLGATYSAGATLVALTSVVWMRGGQLRVPAAFLSLVGLAALAAVAFGGSYPSFLAAFLLAGIGFGGVYSLTIAVLARTADPNRGIGWQWGLGSVPGIFLLYALPLVGSPGGGVRATFLLVAAANLAVAFLAIGLPGQLGLPRKVEFSADTPILQSRAAVWICLFAVFAFYLGITGAWAFFGRIASQSGLSARYAGSVLAIATAASSAIGFLAGEIGDTGARRRFMTAAVAAMLTGLVSIGYFDGRVGYALGTILFIGLATYLLTFSIGLVARLDTTGRAAGLPAAALGAGSILGPAVAGHVYQENGARIMLLVCGLSLIAGLVGYLLVFPKSMPRRSRESRERLKNDPADSRRARDDRIRAP